MWHVPSLPCRTEVESANMTFIQSIVAYTFLMQYVVKFVLCPVAFKRLSRQR